MKQANYRLGSDLQWPEEVSNLRLKYRVLAKMAELNV